MGRARIHDNTATYRGMSLRYVVDHRVCEPSEQSGRLRHKDDVGAAAVMMLALLRLRAELEAGDLSGLADGDIRRQDT